MNNDKNEKRNKNIKPIEVVSLKYGNVVAESTYDPEKKLTAFIVKNELNTRKETIITTTSGLKYMPIRGNSKLLSDKVLLLPSEPKEYGDTKSLLALVQHFIQKYVGTSPEYETVAAHYVLLSWVYDHFNEVPYLRLIGNPGSGKTRFLSVLGKICYKGTFAGGSSTPASLMRLTDQLRGSLMLDEANFSYSDMTATMMQILNQGYGNGFPILRTEGRNGVFNTQSFNVFGPKVIATRTRFVDDALESRCLTEVMNGTRGRNDIPETLPKEFEVEALELRNQLLSYRFNFSKEAQLERLVIDKDLHPRIRQIYLPLLTVSPSHEDQILLVAGARKHHQKLVQIIRDTPEYEVLLGLIKASETTQKPTVQQIRQASKVEMSERAVGEIIRRKLLLTTTRTQHGYVVPLAENQHALIEAQRRFSIQSIDHKNERHERTELLIRENV